MYYTPVCVYVLTMCTILCIYSGYVVSKGESTDTIAILLRSSDGHSSGSIGSGSSGSKGKRRKVHNSDPLSRPRKKK